MTENETNETEAASWYARVLAEKVQVEECIRGYLDDFQNSTGLSVGRVTFTVGGEGKIVSVSVRAEL